MNDKTFSVEFQIKSELYLELRHWTKNMRVAKINSVHSNGFLSVNKKLLVILSLFFLSNVWKINDYWKNWVLYFGVLKINVMPSFYKKWLPLLELVKDYDRSVHKISHANLHESTECSCGVILDQPKNYNKKKKRISEQFYP